MSGRPTFTDLVDHAEGRLSPERAAEVEAALADDADGKLARTLAWIADFHERTRALPLTRPPAALSSALRAMFIGARDDTATGAWSTASLLYDTHRHGIAAVRSSGPAPRQLAFETEQGRFVIEVQPADGDTVHLSGLVLIERPDRTGETGETGDTSETGETGIGITFLEAGTVRGVTHCHRDGHFESAAVPRTVDEVQLVVGDVRVRAELDLVGG